MKLSLSIFGRTFVLALTNEPDPEAEDTTSAGAWSTVEFGFAPSAAPGRGEYWEDEA